MMPTAEQHSYNNGIISGFLHPQNQWSVRWLEQVQYHVENNPELEKNYQEGCIAAKALKAELLLKIAKHFDTPIISITAAFLPILDRLFKAEFSIQTSVFFFEKKLSQQMGWQEVEVALKEIIPILKDQSLRRGIRLLVAYCYQNKQLAAYKDMLTLRSQVYYQPFDYEKEGETVRNTALQIATSFQ